MQDFTDILIGDLRQTKRKFNRLLGLGLIFTLIGYLYIILPYFQYKSEEKYLSETVKILEKESERLSNQLNKTETAAKRINASLQKIKDQINYFPTMLNRKLPEIRDSLYGGIANRHSRRPQYQQMDIIPTERMIIPSHIKTFSEAVRWYTNRWFGDILERLKQNVIEPALEISPNGGEDAIGNLFLISDRALKNIQKYINEIDPEFWRSYYGGKVPVARGLVELVENEFKPLYEEVMTIINRVKTTIEKKKAELEDIKMKMSTTQQKIDNLKERINSLESPIGKLPVDLTDFIKLFPILLVVLIVMLTLIVFKSHLINRVVSPKLNEEKPVDNEALNLVLRCWYLPPYKKLYIPLLVVTIYLLIGAILLHTSILVFKEPGLFKSFTKNGFPFLDYLFYTAYLSGIVIYTACLFMLIKLLSSKTLKTQREG